MIYCDTCDTPMHKAAQPLVLVGLRITKGDPTGFSGLTSLGLELYLSDASSPHVGSIRASLTCPSAGITCII